ncbi:DNA polymerase zeta, partial [Coemansia biformis]
MATAPWCLDGSAQAGPDAETGASTSASASVLDVLVMHLDSYQAPPMAADRALNAPFNVLDAPLTRVPVIRVFGAARSGQRVCLHVHQVWPYMYVRYSGPRELRAVCEFGRQLGRSLNHALCLVLPGQEAVFVAGVVPVKGIPFYGYHAGYHPFLKIQLSNPGIAARASSLLASGAVMGRRFDVFASHLPYTLQFLVDYNLYGMEWIQMESVRFRSPLPDPAMVETSYGAEAITDTSVPTEHRWIPQGMPSYLVHPTPPERMSCCELEVDTEAAAIVNRRHVRERRIHHQIHESADSVPQGRLVHSLDVIWEAEGKRRAQHRIPGPWPPERRGRGALDGNSLHPRPEPRWSNHWRMQSLLASVAASDRRRGQWSGDGKPFLGATDSQRSPCSSPPGPMMATPAGSCAPTPAADAICPGTDDAWLDDWPTCREVDLGFSQQWLDRVGCEVGFCTSKVGDGCMPVAGLPPPPPELPEMPSSRGGSCHATRQSLGELHSQMLGYDPADASAAAKCAARPDGGRQGLAEGGLRIQHNPDHRDLDNRGGLLLESGDDAGSDVCSGVGDLGSLSDFEEEDVIWLEAEIASAEGEEPAAEMAYHSIALNPHDTRRHTTSIPQADGAGDIDSGGERVLRRRKRETGHRQTRKSGRRVLAPLVLATSGAPARPAKTKADVAQELPRPPTQRSIPHKCGAEPKLHSGMPCVNPVGGDPQPRTCGNDAALTGIQHKHPAYEPFVDIPHCEGSICGARRLPAKEPARPEHHMRRGGFFRYARAPPCSSQLLSSMALGCLPEIVAPRPRFSVAADAPRKHQPGRAGQPQPGLHAAAAIRLFDSECTLQSSSIARPRPLDDDIVRAARSEQRSLMWGPAAVRELNDHCHSVRSPNTKWSSGWWEFARPPPSRPQLLRCAGPGGAGHSTLTAPVKCRQRDQSDLKWSSVLGNLTQQPVFAGSDAATAHEEQLTTCSRPPIARQRPAAKENRVAMSLLSLEILAGCSSGALPNPRLDSVVLVATAFAPDGTWSGDAACVSVVWTCGTGPGPIRLGLPSHVQQRHHSDELDMIQRLAGWVRQIDPDILCGYEVQKASWGYLIERAAHAYGLQLDGALSRVVYRPPRASHPGSPRARDGWGYRKNTAIKVVGRHVLNVWRLMRSELSLTSYTFERIAKEVLGEQQPRHAPSVLVAWYGGGTSVARIRALRYVLCRAQAVLRILDKTNVVTRAAEFASVIGIDFHSVLTRGSQFRVESLMARIAHPELFVLSSPTREQVAQQRAAECLSLVLEPQSGYYTDPVVVLDFQSLYPSIMIAYNYCFSTCLGSLDDAGADCGASSAGSDDAGQRRRLGFTSLRVPPGVLSMLKGHIHVSPNGMMFVQPSVRKGLLGRMLQEILESRVMIKGAMKQWGAGDATLHSSLDSWQLGLKLIANVTYGYAGASFSGRMPCAEIADAIVQSGRETLESAIRLVHSRHAEWGARVVYGDTDSMFVHLPGKSRQSAFRIGREIAEAVTALNPDPVTLKLEKVYQPCMLLTKKRYAGWMFASAEQADPQLDVKGMELIRRDGCAAARRILEGTITALFESNDLSRVKRYVVEQVAGVLQGEAPAHEFVIAKEVRMHSYSGRVLPAHAKVAVDGMARDWRAEPEHGERVPYVVVNGGGQTRLVDRVVSPQALLAQPHLQLDYQYYVGKQIAPALDRVLGLVGVDVHSWIGDMPRRLRSNLCSVLAGDTSDGESGNDAGRSAAPGAGKRAGAAHTLYRFYHTRTCAVCRQTMPAAARPPKQASAGGMLRICSACAADAAGAAARAGSAQMGLGRRLKAAVDECAACVGGPRAAALDAVERCGCTDCPTLQHNIRDLELHRTLLGHDGCVNALCWSADGRLLFSGSDDSTICVWRAAGDGSLLCRFRTGFGERVFDLKVLPAPNDHLLVACSMDSTTKVFDTRRILDAANSASVFANTSRTAADGVLDDGGSACVRTFTAHAGAVKRVAVIPDSPHELLSCSEDGTVRHFDIRENPRATHVGPRRRAGDGRVVADYRDIGAEIHALDVNPLRPAIFAAGGSLTSIMVHDRRLPRVGAARPGMGGHPPSSANWSGDRCVVRLRRNKPETRSNVFEQLSDEVVTGLRFSRDEADVVIGSWCYDHVYLFDLGQSSTYTQAAGDEVGMSGVGLVRALADEYMLYPSKRVRVASASAMPWSGAGTRGMDGQAAEGASSAPSGAGAVQAQLRPRTFGRGSSFGVRLLGRDEAPY